MIGIFLKYDNLIVQLPVLPESLSVQQSSNNTTSQIVKLGEITNIGIQGLKSLSIDSFLPMFDAPYVQTSGSFKKPQFYLDFIERVRKERKPIRLVITDTEINMMVSIESFDYNRMWGTEDISYTLSLKEYKPHSIRKLTISATNEANKSGTTNNNTKGKVSTVGGSSSRPVEKAVPKTYKVKSGDTLWGIAQRNLGNGSKWQSIYNLNKSIIKNPNLIYPGQVLTLP